ncbi:MAG: hypothetical protein ABIC19_02350 [Patescibacteria group bacterium]|nr:hypothetical protein [Patescibacteria group bacterium]
MKIPLITLMLFMLFLVSGCESKTNETNKNNQQQAQDQSDQPVEFPDPGSDQLGQEVKEMDTIVNSLNTGYNKEDLSSEAIEQE